MYQARVAADNIVGTPRTANYEGIPRVVFGEPEIAAVGLADAIARPWTFEQNPRGTFGLVADGAQNQLLGAYAVAPLASE